MSIYSPQRKAIYLSPNRLCLLHRRRSHSAPRGASCVRSVVDAHGLNVVSLSGSQRALSVLWYFLPFANKSCLLRIALFTHHLEERFYYLRVKV